MKNIGLYLVILFNLVAFGLSSGEERSGGDAIDNAESAVERAVKYIGLDSVDGFKITKSPKEIAKAVYHERIEQLFPCLARLEISTPGWETDISCTIRENDGGDRTYMYNFNICTDAKTGIPLYIYGMRDNKEISPEYERFIDEAMTPMTSLKEQYHYVPDSASSMTFTELLKRSVNDIESSQVLSAAYVKYTQNDSTFVPAWVICLIDVPPVGHMNDDDIVIERHVYDARNGSVLFSGFYVRNED